METVRRAGGKYRFMVRGTFANTRMRNQLAPGQPRAGHHLLPDGGRHPIFEDSALHPAGGLPA